MPEDYHAHVPFRSTKMTHVADQEDRLKAVGISRLDADAAPELYAELFRIARRVRESERTVVGLLPTGPKVAVAPMMVELGFALTDACEGAVAVVDANTRYPALRSIAGARDERSKKSGFTTTWVADFLAVVTPPELESSRGMGLDRLDQMLQDEVQGFVHVLVDLTGFEQAGEHWGMLDTIDGVLLVGHPGETREHDLTRLAADLPRDKVLGVILVG